MFLKVNILIYKMIYFFDLIFFFFFEKPNRAIFIKIKDIDPKQLRIKHLEEQTSFRLKQEMTT